VDIKLEILELALLEGLNKASPSLRPSLLVAKLCKLAP
jgi:hypothetical protein